MQHRRPVASPLAPAEAEQDDAADPDDERIGDDVVDPRHLTQRAHQQGEAEGRQPRAPIRHRAQLRGMGPKLAQEHQRGEGGNKGAVAVFRQRPGLRQRRQPFVQEQTRPKRGQGEPDEAGMPHGRSK